MEFVITALEQGFYSPMTKQRTSIVISSETHLQLVITAKRRKITVNALLGEMIAHCLGLKRFTKDVEVKE